MVGSLFAGNFLVDPVDEATDTRVYSWVSRGATEAKWDDSNDREHFAAVLDR